jgi:GNAT superfamily N-acetyltransferase
MAVCTGGHSYRTAHDHLASPQHLRRNAASRGTDGPRSCRYASAVTIEIRRASVVDWLAVWPIWQAIVSAQETYMFDPFTPAEQAQLMWFPDPPAETWVAVHEDRSVVGTYLLKPNGPGPGSHLANAGFMVAPAARGGGIGRRLAEHCLARARECNYLGMQFNAVVATNEGAIRLWQSLGFAIVGTVPQAYRHRTAGLVDVHVMYRAL